MPITPLESVLGCMPIGVAVFDRNLRIVQCNLAMSLLGKSAGQEPVPLPFRVAFPALASALELLMKTVVDTSRPVENLEIEQPEHNRRIQVSIHLLPDHEPGSQLFGLTVVPIAMRPPGQTEDAILRAIFERSTIAMLVVEWAGGGMRTNPAVSKMLGYSEEELKHIGIQAISHPDDFAEDLQLFQELFDRKREHYEINKRYIRKDGAVIWGHLFVSCARDAEGQMTLIIAMIEDITKRKVAELERDHMVGELEKSLREREVFLSVASHELRTPLTPLLMALQVLQRKVDMGEPNTGRELGIALLQTNRLMALVEKLLDLSRIENKIELYAERVDLTCLVQEVCVRYGAEAAAAGCLLKANAGSNVLISADPVRIEQVISNLLTNAMKFGAGQPIEVQVEQSASSARVSVRDYGIGLNEEDQERIFGRFERAVSEKNFGGLGLGLYISRRIAAAHGGQIWVESTPGQGAKFIFEVAKIQ